MYAIMAPTLHEQNKVIITKSNQQINKTLDITSRTSLKTIVLMLKLRAILLKILLII